MKIILSIDGGGIRGLVPATILSVLEGQLGPVATWADMIAGTSTGGILAAVLSHTKDGKTPAYSASKVVDLYFDHGAEIFPKRHWYDPSVLLGTRYPAAGIEGVLKAYIGSTMLTEALTEVLITAMDVEKSEPKFFKRSAARVNPSDQTENVPLWYAARATSAAQTYFPPCDQYIDGGMAATDPAMCAKAEAINLWGKQEKVIILSLGTGYKPANRTRKTIAKWLGAQWIGPTIDILQTGNSTTAEYQLNQICDPGEYFRVQGEVPGGVDHAMDNADMSNMRALKEFGLGLYDRKAEMLAQFVSIVQTKRLAAAV